MTDSGVVFQYVASGWHGDSLPGAGEYAVATIRGQQACVVS